MTDAELAEVRVTADFLRAVGRVDWLSTGLTLLAIAAAVFFRANLVAAVTAVAVGVVAKVYALRVAFDARLFERAASGTLDARSLDQALGSLSLGKRGTAERPWTDRCRGAMRLARIFSAMSVAQVVVTVGMLVLRYV